MYGFCGHRVGLEQLLQLLSCYLEASVERLSKESATNAGGEEDVEHGIAPTLSSIPNSLHVIKMKWSGIECQDL